MEQGFNLNLAMNAFKFLNLISGYPILYYYYYYYHKNKRYKYLI